MIDIARLREDPEAVRENIKKKFQDHKLPLVDEALELDKQYRAAITRASELRSMRNKLSKEMNFNITNNYSFKRISDFNGTYSSRIVRKDIKDEIYILDNVNDINVYNYETNGYEKVYDFGGINEKN